MGTRELGLPMNSMHRISTERDFKDAVMGIVVDRKIVHRLLYTQDHIISYDQGSNKTGSRKEAPSDELCPLSTPTIHQIAGSNTMGERCWRAAEVKGILRLPHIILPLLHLNITFQAVHQALDVTSSSLESATHALHNLKREMESLSQPSLDIPAAVEVLTTGRYALPQILRRTYVGDQPLTPKEVEETVSRLEGAMRVRLVVDEVVPTVMRKNMRIGQLIFFIWCWGKWIPTLDAD